MAEIPAESFVRLETVAAFEMGQSPPSETVRDDVNAGAPFLQGNADFTDKHPIPRQACLQPRKVCKRGDALISVRAPVGAINVADRDYCIGRGLAAVRFTGAHPGYGIHALRFSAPSLRRVSQGTTFEAIGRRELGALQVWVPSLPEQRPIAEILDTLDEAVRKTEQIIAKLQQVKQGLLHDLLTRGIDDNGELRDPDRHPEQFKDSPLGRIPKDWVVAPLSHWNIGFIDGDRGTEYPSEADFFPEGHCLFLSAKNVTKTGFRFEEVAFISQSKHTRLRNGALVREDIVVTTRGTLGNFAYFDETVPYQFLRINSGMVIIRAADARLSVPYLFETLCSPIVQRQITTYAYGSAQPQLNLDILRGLLVAVPPQAEQSLLVDRLSAARHRERSTTGELSKLRLLKSGLMEDLLTGRVRVTKLLEQAAE